MEVVVVLPLSLLLLLLLALLPPLLLPLLLLLTPLSTLVDVELDLKGSNRLLSKFNSGIFPPKFPKLPKLELAKGSLMLPPNPPPPPLLLPPEPPMGFPAPGT